MSGCPPAVFDLIVELIHHHIKKEVTNFRKPLEVGLKLATVETYTSLQYQTTICKFDLVVCLAIFAEFQEEYLTSLTIPENWKQIEEKFRTRWKVLLALRALDDKHVMKKSKRTESEYYNYKGLFSLVLLVMVDADYRFLWVDVGSLSDAQICSISKLGKRSRIASWGFRNLNPWGDDTFASMPCLVKLYSRRQGKRDSKLQDLQRQEGCGECVWNPGKQIKGTYWAQWSRDIALTCVSQHGGDTPRWTRQGTYPSRCR